MLDIEGALDNSKFIYNSSIMDAGILTHKSPYYCATRGSYPWLVAARYIQQCGFSTRPPPPPQLLFGCTRSKEESCLIGIRAQDGPPTPITQVASQIFHRIFNQTMKGILGTTIMQLQNMLDNRLTPEIPFPCLPWVPTSTPPMTVSTIAAIWIPRGQTSPRVTRIRACRAQALQTLHRPDMDNTRSKTTPQALVWTHTKVAKALERMLVSHLEVAMIKTQCHIHPFLPHQRQIVMTSETLAHSKKLHSKNTEFQVQIFRVNIVEGHSRNNSN